MYVTVGRDGEHVVWTGWRNPVKESVDLPELRFSADQYEAEVRRAGADLDWEWPGETVARLLEAALREHDDWPARWDCDLDSIWSARMEPGRIDMMLTFPRGAADTDRLWLQFGLTPEISADDPSKQVEQLVARLTAGDPRAVAKVWGGSQAAAEHFGYPWPPDYP
ncbi:hypothetical protein ACFRCG_41030 [Embleya sp. NPDC056575]|uniref:hypothetical protein n=1 Tax=unclassified Embleya TaxID=2699296 RepID=UPI003696ECA9